MMHSIHPHNARSGQARSCVSKVYLNTQGRLNQF